VEDAEGRGESVEDVGERALRSAAAQASVTTVSLMLHGGRDLGLPTRLGLGLHNSVCCPTPEALPWWHLDHQYLLLAWPSTALCSAEE
jgi:hypothetical protein